MKKITNNKYEKRKKEEATKERPREEQKINHGEVVNVFRVFLVLVFLRCFCTTLGVLVFSHSSFRLEIRDDLLAGLLFYSASSSRRLRISWISRSYSALDLRLSNRSFFLILSRLRVGRASSISP